MATAPSPRAGPRITDVAKAAGVSRATVSRVMNGNSSVDPEIAARVRDLAAAMRYRPSKAARSLSLGRTDTVAVIVPDLANPNYQEVLRGVAAAAERQGYRILVAETRDAAALEEGVVLDARERCDAVVLVAPRMPEASLRPLLARVAPAVVINRDPDEATPSIQVDYASGVRELVEHLVFLGHRHVLYLSGPPDSLSQHRRIDALRAAAAARADLRLSELHAGATLDAGYQIATAVLETHATAALAYNDLVAFGLLVRLNELGVAVPNEISVTGFDDIDLARFATPPLTTAAIDQAQLGRLAWRQLHAVLGGDRLADPPAVRPRIAIRSSTGAVPAALRLAHGELHEPGTDHRSLTSLGWTADDQVHRLEGTCADGAKLPLARYLTGDHLPDIHSPRPYLHPVHTIDGFALTDASPRDHRHQYGLSMAIPRVNGSNYSGGRTFIDAAGTVLMSNQGRQVPVERSMPAPHRLLEQLHWRGPDGEVQLTETRTVSVAVEPEVGGWMLIWESVLHASHGDIVISPSMTLRLPHGGYGGVFWRMGQARQRHLFGPGVTTEVEAHGSAARWLAFVQEHGAHQTTLLLVQDPELVLPWFVRLRDYPGAGPALAWDRDRRVAEGEDLRVRLAAVVVDGALDVARAESLAAGAFGRD